MASAYYRPSGRVSVLAFALLLLVIALTVPSAWLLAWVSTHFNSLVAAVFTVGYALLLAIGVFAVAEHGKVRNPILLTIMALAIGIGGWYVQWAQYAGMMAAQQGDGGHTFSGFLVHPTYLLAALWQSASGRHVAELALLALGPALIALGTASAPFCEASQTWVKELKLERHFAAIGDDALAAFKAALASDPDQLPALLAPAAPDAARFTTLSLFLCDGAPQAWLSVFNVSRVVRNGKDSDARSCIVKYLCISPDLARRLANDDAAPDRTEITPPELDDALEALEAGQFSTAMSLAAPYCTAGKTALRNDANRICALSCSRLGRWEDARRYWKALYEHEIGAHNALQIAASSAMAGQLAQAEEWFARAKALNEQEPGMPAVLMYTSFITALKNGDNLRAALPYLAWMRDLYQNLHTTDSTFLTLRGVPFFESFLEQSAPIVEASLSAEKARAWYESMLPHLDQDGRDQLTAWLAQRAPA
jgi:hypothetical protein